MLLYPDMRVIKHIYGTKTQIEVQIKVFNFTYICMYVCMYIWRRKWQLTPVFLPGESQGQRRLVVCHLWGRIELDTTEVT